MLLQGVAEEGVSQYVTHAAAWALVVSRAAEDAVAGDDDEGNERRRLVPREDSTWVGRRFLSVEWNSTDMWDLGGVLADIISDGLSEFLHTSRQTGPRGMTDDEWDAVLVEMVDGFRAVREERDGELDDDARLRFHRAVDLLKRHLLDLRAQQSGGAVTGRRSCARHAQ
jgi:hypothetical protein